MSALHRFLGGSPIGVVIRLAVFSLLVGMLLSWLEWTPLDVWYGVREMAWMAWDQLGRFGDWIMLGAVIVVPVFIVSRILNYRGRSPQ